MRASLIYDAYTIMRIKNICYFDVSILYQLKFGNIKINIHNYQ